MVRERKAYYKEHYQENRDEILDKQRQRYQANRDKKLAYQREYRKRKTQEDAYWQTRKSHMEFARVHGMNFDEFENWYNKQWMKQQAQCAVCGKVFSGNEVIDHCHETNKLRGLLCTKCNVGVGMFQNSPQFCDKAKAYLISNHPSNS